MGEKTRGNYGTGGWCNKRDCVNRDTIKCNECFNHNGEMTEYEQKQED